MAGAYVDDDDEGFGGLFHEDTQASAVLDFVEPAINSPPQDEDDVDSNGDGDEEPPWLMLGEPLENDAVAEETQSRADYLESLPEDSDRPVADLEDVCGNLMQYLIGHPASLITKMRKFGGKKGSKSRYFGEEKSDDVMADKTITGCWACGKLDHESDECPFKRCFNCSAMGHQYFECTVSKANKCGKCKNPGHEQDDCPLIEYEAGLIKRKEGDPIEGEDGTEYTDLFFCRCMKCGGDAHVNCGSIPVGHLATPDECVAAVSPGCEADVSWDVAPIAPKQMLRPRGPQGKSTPMQALGGNDDNACWDFLQSGFCARGDACSYSHGEAVSPKGGSKGSSWQHDFGKKGPKAPSLPPPGKNGPRAPSQPPPAYRAPSSKASSVGGSRLITPSKRPHSGGGEDWGSLYEEEEETSELEDSSSVQRPWARSAGNSWQNAPRPSVAIGARGQQYSVQPQRQNGGSWNNGQWNGGGNSGGNWSSNNNGGGRWGGSGGQPVAKRWKQW